MSEIFLNPSRTAQIRSILCCFPSPRKAQARPRAMRMSSLDNGGCNKRETRKTVSTGRRVLEFMGSRGIRSATLPQPPFFPLDIDARVSIRLARAANLEISHIAEMRSAILRAADHACREILARNAPRINREIHATRTACREIKEKKRLTLPSRRP